MAKTAENKKYATDTRKYSDAVLADKIHETFTDSPITDKLMIKDMCYRGVGFLGQHGKETKTSWDTLSYTLIQAHNVYQHISAVQEANRQYDTGVIPSMVMNEVFDRIRFGDIVETIFALKDKEKSLNLIDKYDRFWQQMKSGSQGFSGKKTVNALTKFEELFKVQSNNVVLDDEEQDSDELMLKNLEN